MDQKLVKLGEALLNKMLSITFSKQYADISTSAYKVAKFLTEYFDSEELETLIKEVDEKKIQRTYIYENDRNIFKYHVMMEYKDYKITFIITEEKRDIEWVITNVEPGSVWIPITKVH